LERALGAYWGALGQNDLAIERERCNACRPPWIKIVHAMEYLGPMWVPEPARLTLVSL